MMAGEDLDRLDRLEQRADVMDALLREIVERINALYPGALAGIEMAEVAR